MPDNTIIPVRAKAGYIAQERYDKAGRVVPARNHVVSATGGVMSGKEMERVMREVAADVGADESQIRVETYAKGEAPVEANPRHRGIPPRLERKTNHTIRKPHVRTLWSGGIPQTPEEWAAYVADFEARRATQPS